MMCTVTNPLGPEWLPQPLRSRRNQLLAAVALVVVVLIVLVAALLGRDSDDSDASSTSAPLAMACNLNDTAVHTHARLDGASGPTTAALMAEAQLLGMAGTGHASENVFIAFGRQLALTTQRQDTASLAGLLDRIGDRCDGESRRSATPANEAQLACDTSADLADAAPSPKALGEENGPRWAQLRAVRYVAAAAAARSSTSYADLVDATSDAYLAAAQTDAKGWTTALKAVSAACGKL